MKNSIFKSFRFEIVFYSLLSLLLTIVSEALLFLVGIVIKTFISNGKRPRYAEQSQNTAIPDLLPPLNAGGEAGNLEAVSKQSNYLIPILLIGTAIIIGIVLFIMFFLLLTRRFMVYLDEIASGVNNISAGDFNTRININSEDEFAQIAGQINKMADDVNRIMENERNNEAVKNELIASVAHDLRTPLTSIIGYLELVSRNNRIDEDVKSKYISIAYDKSKRLEKLIEDLFAYTKFSFGEVAMSYQQVDMVQFVEQLLEEFYPSFQENDLDYEFETNTNRAVIMADGDLLVRAFANIIGNAVKYGKHGKKIKIRLHQEDHKVTVTVTNYGEMIPKKDIENIFDKFYRVESSRSSETGGAGLGLAIAKNIVSMHSGTIAARSDYRGTVFEVVLDEKNGKESNNSIETNSRGEAENES